MRRLLTAAVLTLVSVSAYGQFWQSTDGPPSATTCMTVTSKGHVFVGTPFSKVYRTKDNGNTWEALDQGIDDGGPNWFPINQLVHDANDHLYAAVNGLGLLRSTDDGNTWNKLNVGLEVTSNSRISVSVKSAAGTPTQIFMGYDAGASNLRARFSSDGGATFINIPVTGLPSGTSSLFEVFLSPNSNKMFISVAYNKGLFRSTDRGTSWRRIDNGDGNSNESDDLYATFAYDKFGHIYVGRNALPGSSKTPNAVVLKSTNDGESWRYLDSAWDDRDVTNNRISAIAFAPNGDMWVGTEKSSGPFRGPNYGEVFTVMRDGLPGDGSVSGIAVTPAGHVFVAPTGESVQRHLATTSVAELGYPAVVRAGIAPQPASDRIGVTFTPAHDGQAVIDLLSAVGERVIMGATMSVRAGDDQRVWLSTAELPQGTYVVRITVGGGVSTTSVVVAK
ncbi:MAG: hypothetical protein RLZZ150_969 [Bacteroidota bacterium]|jgi:photosystem II stability/assembly factor-like uncharacterized protein